MCSPGLRSLFVDESEVMLSLGCRYAFDAYELPRRPSYCPTLSVVVVFQRPTSVSVQVLSIDNLRHVS